MSNPSWPDPAHVCPVLGPVETRACIDGQIMAEHSDPENDCPSWPDPCPGFDDLRGPCSCGHHQPGWTPEDQAAQDAAR